MSRTLLCGPAGSGKTRAVLAAVRPLLAGTDGTLPRFLVLVPTYSQAEYLKRRCLRESGADGLLDRGVVTFEQLAERRTGIRLASLAPAAVRDAVLAAAFEEVDDEAFRAVARFPGLRRAALRFLDEVKALEPDPGVDVVAVAAERLGAAAGALRGQRGALVAALVRVLGVYERRRLAEGLRDHGDLVRELLRRLRDGGPSRDGGSFRGGGPSLDGDPSRDGAPSKGGRYALFAMDGFTDLTPVQEAIVHHLAAAADRSIVTLVADAEDRPGSPFGAGERLRTRLVEAGFRAETAGPSRRFAATSELARLERRLAGVVDEVAPPETEEADPPPRHPARGNARGACPAESAAADAVRAQLRTARASASPTSGGADVARAASPTSGAADVARAASPTSGAADECVRFLAGADPDDEADRVARTVLRWTTEGIERSEILVVVRSLASQTAARVLEALARHGVPARRLGGEPLASVPCVRSALRVMRLVAGGGDAADLVAALRAGDARGVADADADRFGLLVRERGALDEAAVRALAVEAKAATVAAWCDALAKCRHDGDARPPAAVARELLAPIPTLLRLRFAEPFDDLDATSVARDAAAMRALRDLVADLVRGQRASGSPAIRPAEAAARIEAAVDAARFSPPDLRDDVVHVVDAEEARQWEARAVVVAGLRMGEFPATAREDLFLSDAERASVEKTTGLRLPNRLDEALRREQLLFYAAATRAKERLVLTCPIADDAGNPVIRSPFLDLAMSILPPDARRLDGADRSPGDVRPAPGETLHAADLERTALAALTERFATGTATEVRPHVGYALLPHLVRGDASVVRRAARWFAPAEASIREGGAARGAVAAPRLRSATALGDFAQCPYRHFARKGLGLEELRAGAEDGIDGMLAGSIAHKALELAVKGRISAPLDVAALVDRVFREMAGNLRRDLRVEAVRAELRRCVAAHLAETFRTSRAGGVVDGFVPTEFEWKFGAGGPAVAVGPGGATVGLTGAADRIDVAEADGGGVADDGAPRDAIVLDYKWSRRDRYSGIERKIESGADLQLPIYAIAARRALGVRVVAVGYITLRDEGVKWLRVSADAPVGGGTRTKPPEGWGEGDGSAGLARAEAHIVELDRRIRGGECVARPLDENRCGAGRCPFADLCRFEGQPG